MGKQTIIVLSYIWIYLFSFLISIPCISFGNDETVTVYNDPLNLGNIGSISQFQLNRTGHNFDLNSVEWIIDDTIHVVNGSDFSSVPSASVVSLWISGSAAQKQFSTGIHTVKVTVRYDDSTITKTWNFNFRKVEYKMFATKIVKDKSRSDNLNSYYTVINAAPMDTSVFCCSCTELDTVINYDTTGICYQFRCDVDRTYTYDRDTMSCFVLQQILGQGVCDQSLISRPVEDYLSMTTSSPDTLKYPFSLDIALACFNARINENSIRKAYITISGPLKLGPLLKLQQGDPGWKLKATYDENFWYILHNVGSGDCPCGCIDWNSRLYTISPCGILYDAVVNSSYNKKYQSADRRKKLSYDLLGRLIPLRQKNGIADGIIVEKSNGFRAAKVKIRE